jgi:hypothetical protein
MIIQYPHGSIKFVSWIKKIIKLKNYVGKKKIKIKILFLPTKRKEMVAHHTTRGACFSIHHCHQRRHVCWVLHLFLQLTLSSLFCLLIHNHNQVILSLNSFFNYILLFNLLFIWIWNIIFVYLIIMNKGGSWIIMILFNLY